MQNHQKIANKITRLASFILIFFAAVLPHYQTLACPENNRTLQVQNLSK
ncbi:exported hypothetical protein [Planktothrix sp. PCC 11201]|nr:hypothetical protein [Planktothrix sp. PCC 11201]SKB11128.1 exported hypothetical protein [Planktothrix sp. PCC 11201]